MLLLESRLRSSWSKVSSVSAWMSRATPMVMTCNAEVRVTDGRRSLSIASSLIVWGAMKMTNPSPFQHITSEQELNELLGAPKPSVLGKDRSLLHPRDRDWLAVSPFCLVATSAAAGTCDVSPKGDPAGIAHVIDDGT